MARRDVWKKSAGVFAAVCLTLALILAGCDGTGSPAGDSDIIGDGSVTGPPGGGNGGGITDPPEGPITIDDATGIAFQRMGDGYAVVRRPDGSLFYGALVIPAVYNELPVVAIW